MCSPIPTYSQCRIPFCYTGGFIYAVGGMTVPPDFFARYTARHLRIMYLAQFIFVGAVYYNVLTTCATLLCRACLDEITCVAVMYLTLRTGYERHGRKNPLPFPYFAAVTCRQSAPDYPRERGDSQEGGNRRCLPSCAPARRQRTPRRGTRQIPRLISSEKPPAR